MDGNGRGYVQTSTKGEHIPRLDTGTHLLAVIERHEEGSVATELPIDYQSCKDDSYTWQTGGHRGWHEP